MNKLFLVLMLVLMIFQPLLLHATVKAEDPPSEIICPEIVTFTTLPATEITDLSAVFNGTVTQVARYGRPTTQQENENIMVFEYGTSPGLYPYRTTAEVVAHSWDSSIDGEEFVLTLSATYRGMVSNLSACTTYYVRLRWLGTIPVDADCLSVIGPNVISFVTIGCPTLIGTGPTSHGTGGFNGTTITQPTNLSNIVVQRATITSTKVSPGEKVDVTANVINKGNSNGTSKVTLYINGQVAESRGITLTNGETTQVHFSVSQNDPGTYSVYVNGVPAGSFVVDAFNNNNILIYGVIGLFTIGIIGVLYLVVRRRAS